MAKRSATFKQFLLRVHPDHFRRLPQVHDENLQSIQLLNQFMDERGASWSLAHSSNSSNNSKKVHFSVYLASSTPLAPGNDEQVYKVKRFALALSPSIERGMQAILRECGVAIQDTEPLEQQQQQQRQQRTGSSTSNDSRRPRERSRRRKQSSPRSRAREESDMDFESSMHDMYEALRAQSLSASRRKRPILSMKDLLAFMAAEQTRVVEQQRYSAWLSIQSVRGTLQREFGIAEVATSCGWAAMHLNATLMVLLKTLRKYTRAQSSGGGSSMFTPSAFLRGACVDISSEPSGIDVQNEYRVHLNPTDVPLQWIQVLEQVDDAMLRYMRSARQSLVELQAAATAALGEASSITRGNTCAALPYRGFLQAMVFSGRHSRDAGTESSSVLEQLALVVEDRHYAWRILRDGRVQVPCSASLDDVVQFIEVNRSHIREQRAAHDTQQRELAQVVAMCTHVLGIKAVTHLDTIPVEHVVTACKELLKLAAQVHMGTVAPSSVPNELYGGVNRDLATFLRGRRLRIARSFGLDQDGSFTIPFDWRA